MSAFNTPRLGIALGAVAMMLLAGLASCAATLVVDSSATAAPKFGGRLRSRAARRVVDVGDGRMLALACWGEGTPT